MERNRIRLINPPRKRTELIQSVLKALQSNIIFFLIPAQAGHVQLPCEAGNFSEIFAFFYFEHKKSTSNTGGTLFYLTRCDISFESSNTSKVLGISVASLSPEPRLKLTSP